MFEHTLGIDGEPIPEPLGMHPDYVTGPGFSITIIWPDANRFLVRWCCRNKCGGVYSKAQKRWNLMTPITFDDFLGFLKANNIIPRESWDAWEVRRWVKACRLAANPAPQEEQPHAGP